MPRILIPVSIPGAGDETVIGVSVASASVAAIGQRAVAPIARAAAAGRTGVFFEYGSGAGEPPSLGTFPVGGGDGVFVIAAARSTTPFFVPTDPFYPQAPGAPPPDPIPEFEYVVDISGAPQTIAGALQTTLSILGPGGGAYDLGAGSQTVIAGGGDWLIGAPSVPGTAVDIVLDAGSDTVVAASARATVTTGVGDNTIVDQASAGSLIRSNGSDGIDLTGAAGPATIDAAGAGVTAFGGAGTLSLAYAGTGSVNVIGGSGAHTIAAGAGAGILQGGTDGNNVIFGGAGTTSIRGGGAGDQLFAGSGVTTISAGHGNETLSAAGQAASDYFTAGLGAADADSITGGTGADTLFAGGGADTLTGGAGADRFVFASQYTDGNAVTIADFAPGSDQVVLSGYGADQVAAAVGSFVSVQGGGAITLGDGTKVTLEGVFSVTPADFAVT